MTAAFSELDAFTTECVAIDATLADVPDDAWGLPALGEWSLHELMAHLYRGVTRPEAYLDAIAALPAEATPAFDRVSYWQLDMAAIAPDVAERARAASQGVDPPSWPNRFTEGWRRSAERAAAAGPDALVDALRGPMRLDEYMATRVLEVVVHHIDLRAALGQPPAPTEDAARSVAADLEGLLGEPKPRALGRTRFIRVATGRLPSDDPRFPVLR